MARVTVVSVSLLYVLCSLPANSQIQPVCDVTCSPDPGSGTYAATVAARPRLPNARGSSSPIAPKQTIWWRNGSGGNPKNPGGPGLVYLPGSESYNYAVPILSLPGRNGLDVNLTLYYNSRIWTVDSVNGTVTFNADRDFPSYGFRLGFGYIEKDAGNNIYVLTEADGSKRQLDFAATNSYNSADGSYTNYNPSTKVLAYKNGTRVLYEGFPDFPTTLFRPKWIKDANGNYITIAYVSGSGRNQHISTITDTLGRVITFNYDANGLLTNIQQGTKTYATFTWNTAYTLKYNFSGSLTVADSPANNSTHKVLTGCTYANGTKYNLIYGDWGIVTKMERRSSSNALRSYASYNYPLATSPLSNPPSWTTQTSFDGVNTLSTSFSVTKVGGLVSTYTVSDPGGTKTVTALNTSGTYQGMVSKVEIKDPSNVVLRKIDYVWTNDPGGYPVLSSLTTTLSDTGQQSKVEFSYTTYGNVSLVKEYDFGLVLKRQTSTTYLTTAAYTANTPHILDRPTQVLVKDSAGAIKARTDFAYDLTAPTGLSPAPARHDTTNYGTGLTTRGNVTRITRYSNAAGGTGAFVRNFTYDIAGNLRTADLDCCTTKSWAYSTATQYAYPDSVTSGPAGTQLTTSATYNFASGTVAASTDENSKQSSYQYDGMDRLTTVTLPNSVVLTTSYSDSGISPTVTSSNTANSSVQVTTLDGNGRVIQQQLKNGASVVSTVTTAYSDTQRQVIVGNPQGPNDPTPPVTVTQFDYLGRTVSVSPPGNSNFLYAYSGNVVTITDPAGKQRRNTSDALGRLVQVEEPGFGDGIPGKGSVTISGGVQTYQECPDGDPRNCFTVYDSGTISITVNGVTKSANYGQGSTSANRASALANAMNADASYPVSAGVTGSTIYLTAKAVGVSTNYSLSSTSTTDFPETFGQPSFTGSPSGPNLTGGWNPSGPDTATLITPMPTTYTYDVLDNLLTVAQAQGWPQGGVTPPPQNRSYSYDSLSRLTQAVPSESGTTNFYYTTAAGGTCSYDPSNVCRRVDARNITSTYGYDGLGRLASVSYSDGTPTVTYTYGTSAASNNNGRLITLADGAGSESYTYNTMGWITNVSKVISGVTYNLAYGYNGLGQLTSLTYPSGRIVTQGLDAIGRLSSIASGTTTYLSSPSYNAAGQPLGFNYGNGVAATFSYNDHLQLASLRYVKGSQDLLNLAYNYGAQNNGQIKDIKYYSAPGVEDQTKSQNYEYDAWGRLRRAWTTNLAQQGTWRLEWDYDRFGNRRNQTLTGGQSSITQPQLTISETTNRITTAGYAYDAAGNMTNDSIHAYTYDAENRVKTVDGTAATYTYSGPMRVKKVLNSQGTYTTVYVFSGSKVIAEYQNGSLAKEYVYAGSRLLATHEGTSLKYHHPDHLSTRVETDGTTAATVRTFGQYPFGEIWYETGTASKWKFTSYERDGESGLDQAMFRYYSPRIGRFMSADLLPGYVDAPQSLNRYGYVMNDPVNFLDPLGLDNDCGGPCVPFSFRFGNCTFYITYHKERSADGIIYDIPDLTIECDPVRPEPIGVDGGGGGGAGEGANLTIQRMPEWERQWRLVECMRDANERFGNDVSENAAYYSFGQYLWEASGLGSIQGNVRNVVRGVWGWWSAGQTAAGAAKGVGAAMLGGLVTAPVTLAAKHPANEQYQKDVAECKKKYGNP